LIDAAITNLCLWIEGAHKVYVCGVLKICHSTKLIFLCTTWEAKPPTVTYTQGLLPLSIPLYDFSTLRAPISKQLKVTTSRLCYYGSRETGTDSVSRETEEQVYLESTEKELHHS